MPAMRLTRMAGTGKWGRMSQNDNKPDAIEVWARRLGRGLGYVFMLSIAAYLVATLWPK